MKSINQLAHVLEEFHGRHQKPKAFFERRFQDLRHHLLTDTPLSENRRLLLGAYFTQEYALESAALVQSLAGVASRPDEPSARFTAVCHESASGR